jgi:hypothetical protein
VPRTGLAARTAPYTATITISGSDIWESFEVRFWVGDHVGEGTFTLTLRARSGGLVALGGSRFDTQWTGTFREGERVSIAADPNRDFRFDRWSYSHGETQHEFREETTFVMPNRDVTVWAEFVHYRDWDGRGDPWGDLWWHQQMHPPQPDPTPGAPPVAPPPQPLPPPTPPGAPLPAPAPAPVPEPVLTPLNVNLNGRPINIQGQPAVIRQGVAYIPVEEVFRALGYTVTVRIDGATSAADVNGENGANGSNGEEEYEDAGIATVTMTRGNIVLEVTEGNSTFTINGNSRRMRAQQSELKDT